MTVKNTCLTIVTVLSSLMFAGQAAAGNLVTNGGFETGDFTGWTFSGDTSYAYVETSFRGFAPHSGNYFAVLGPVSEGFLSQEIATLAGQSYTFSWFLGSQGGAPNDFSAYRNGTTIFSVTNLPNLPGDYTQYSFTEVADGPTTTIQFGYSNPPGSQALDDISVTPASVPEPSSLALFGVGIVTFAGYASRRWWQS